MWFKFSFLMQLFKFSNSNIDDSHSASSSTYFSPYVTHETRWNWTSGLAGRQLTSCTGLSNGDCVDKTSAWQCERVKNSHDCEIPLCRLFRTELWSDLSHYTSRHWNKLLIKAEVKLVTGRTISIFVWLENVIGVVYLLGIIYVKLT